jgi:predicted PP-loop superfamily ATPase
MLDGESPRDLEGKALVELLVSVADDPSIDPQDVRELSERLEDILDDVEHEVDMHNARVQLGLLMQRFHPDSWVDNIIDSMVESPLKQLIITHMTKGETYEYNHKSPTAQYSGS